jgi:thiosulfate dehydrogenase [quinone] large subunit
MATQSTPAQRIPRRAAPASSGETVVPSTRGPRRLLAVVRIATGFVFIWAFLDKLLGLGYASQRSPAAS